MNRDYKYEYVATCLFGLESLLGEEIDALGYERIETIDGRVTFRGDLAAIARCNIWLRFAERLYIKMGSFKAATFAELFDGTNLLYWGTGSRATTRFRSRVTASNLRLRAFPTVRA